jgi:hypothetical protein
MGEQDEAGVCVKGHSTHIGLGWQMLVALQGDIRYKDRSSGFIMRVSLPQICTIFQYQSQCIPRGMRKEK